MLAHVLSFGEWWREAPRELWIAVLGLGVGWLIAHIKIDRKAEKRHREQMAAHRAAAGHHGYSLKPAPAEPRLCARHQEDEGMETERRR